MTVDELIKALTAASNAGFGQTQVATQDTMSYRSVDGVQMTKTIYKAQNPTGIPEPFLAVITQLPSQKVPDAA